MSESRRRPSALFQPGIAAMYACTGASPWPLAICGLPPLRSLGAGCLRGLAPALGLAADGCALRLAAAGCALRFGVVAVALRFVALRFVVFGIRLLLFLDRCVERSRRLHQRLERVRVELLAC